MASSAGNFLHDTSEAAHIEDQLDIFSTLATQVAIKGSFFSKNWPVNNINKYSPLVFRIPAESVAYIDLNRIFLKIEGRIAFTGQESSVPAVLHHAKDPADESDTVAYLPYYTKYTGDPTPGAEVNIGTPPKRHTVTPVYATLTDNSLHSLLSQVDVQLNQTLVTAQHPNHNYAAYLQKKLLGDRTTLDATSCFSHFYDDEPEALDSDTGLDMSKTTRMNKRFLRYSYGKRVELIDRLELDLTNQDRVLLSNVEMKITVTFSKPSFHLMVHSVHKDLDIYFQILNAELIVRKLEPSAAVLQYVEDKLAKDILAKYWITRLHCKTFTIAPNSAFVSIESLLIGQLPSKFVFGLVTTERYNGSTALSPYKFYHHWLSRIAVYLDGAEVVPPQQFDFATQRYTTASKILVDPTYADVVSKPADRYMEHFYMLREFLCLNEQARLGASLITEDSYPVKDFLTLVPIAPTLTPGSLLEIPRQGNVRLELTFKTAPTESLTLVLLALYDGYILANKYRAFVTNMSV